MWKKKIEEIKKYIILDTEVDSFDNVKKEIVCMRYSHDYVITDSKAYREKLTELYSPLKAKRISMKKFEDILIQEIISFYCENKQTLEINEKIEEIKNQDYHVLLPLYKVTLKVPQDKLGEWTVVNYKNRWNYIATVLNQGLPEKFPMDNCGWSCSDNLAFIDIIVNAKDEEFAQESASLTHQSIVNALNFMFFQNEGKLKITAQNKQWGDEQYFVVSSEFLSQNTYADNVDETFQLDEYLTFLNNQQKGNYKIFSIIRKEKPENIIEEKLVTAINWIGMAIAERNTSIAFVQAMFAIETLLQNDIKGEPITKSIVATIAEAIAFIMGSDYESRKFLEKDFKRLYGLRSKIAHGKGNDVSGADLDRVIYLARNLVYSFIKKPEIREAKSMIMITNYIEKMRYTTSIEQEAK